MKLKEIEGLLPEKRKEIINLLSQKLCSTRHTQSLCPEIVDTILSNIEIEVDKNKIVLILKNYLTIAGIEKQILIRELTDNLKDILKVKE